MATREEKEAFFRAILDIVRIHRFNYIESIIHYCDEHEMEIETAVLLIDDRLKSLLAQTAEDLHLIPKIGRLPM